ncbi:rCG63712 [Rattus norvegicus]|uniref:RCG63712 n=1 Tax=Rattus norvegicus TaxID=10116 RepID=A6IFP4_RAT|nr:rCG63712 [Rattus norvegicus]
MLASHLPTSTILVF